MRQDPEVSSNLDVMLACDPSTGDYPRPQEYTPQALQELVQNLFGT